MHCRYVRIVVLCLSAGAWVVCAGCFSRNDLSSRVPDGFVELFNGRDLAGWKAVVGSPVDRAAMSPNELAAAEAEAHVKLLEHWRVEEGEIVCDGQGPYLRTQREYGDFELLIDWRIQSGADSGIYLRGTPQVQIWDPTDERQWPNGSDKGSGGLWNNQKGARFPLVNADHPPGQWNSFGIRMVGERVTVHLNGQLIVDAVVMENYWERDKPIYPMGPIELQTHGGELRFRNIFIREIHSE